MDSWREVVVERRHPDEHLGLRQRVDELEVLYPLAEGAMFLVAPDARVDPWLSRTFDSRAWKRLAPSTRQAYIDSLRRFFDFVWLLDERDWFMATEDDYDEYEELRTDSEKSPVIVQPSTWMKDHSAITWLYTRAYAAGKTQLGPSLPGIRATGANFFDGTRVKHTDPSTARHWRDVGLLGYEWDGVPGEQVEATQSLRNCAFFDLLLDSGLRAGEAHSLTVLSRPTIEPGRRMGSSLLQATQTKGNRPRFFYFGGSTVSRIDSYVDGPRNTWIAAARRNGLYNRRAGWETATVLGAGHNPKLVLSSPEGSDRTRLLSQLSVRERAKILIPDGRDWQPLSLWLTSAGLPLKLASWQSVFHKGNANYLHAARRAGVAPELQIRVHMHMLRHTFALVKILAYERLFDKRFGLTPLQRRDYAEVFGDPYVYVQNLLGHSSPETTKSIYLAALVDLRHRAVLEHEDYFEADPSVEYAALRQVGQQTRLVEGLD